MKIRIWLIIAVLTFSSCVSLKRYNTLEIENSSNIQKVDSLNNLNAIINNENYLLRQDIDRFVRNASLDVRNSLYASFNTNNNHSIRIHADCKVGRDKIVTEILTKISEKIKSTPFNSVQQRSFRISSYYRRIVFVHSGYSSILEDNPRYEEIIYILSVYYEREIDAISIHIDYLPMVSSTKSDNQLFVTSTNRLLKYSIAIDNMLIELFGEGNNLYCGYEKN